MHDQDVFLERALLEAQLVTPDQLAAARRVATEHAIGVGEALVRNGVLDQRQIALTRCDVCEVPYIELHDFEICYSNARRIPRSLAERHCVFPLFFLDGVLTLAMDDPLDLAATDQIRRLAKCEVDPVLAQRDHIQALIAKAYSLGHDEAVSESGPAPARTTTVDDTEPVVAAVNHLLADAIEQRASDVHINPDERTLYLRYRVDGVLREKQAPPLSMHGSIVQRLKVMAHLDLTQSRRPQDGKFHFEHRGLQADVRISTMPTVCGENVVMRLLSNAQVYTNWSELGMSAMVSNGITEALDHPYGMLLVTGPTGSGKTTTLYTAIARINDPSRNIMTIEDPVEIRLPYIRQIQVNTEISLTFAAALRSVLRQDPDVVLVGEIRDEETANIALQAALTGHLVLTTLHTNDAVGAVARLRDYGMPPFVVNSALLGVIAQRLVRRVCPDCARPHVPGAFIRKRFGLADDTTGFQTGAGCPRCGHSGYRGRLGLYEFLRFSSPIKRLVEDGAPVEALRQRASADGMRMMWQEGLEKACLGETTLDEVMKVASVVMLDDADVDLPVREQSA